MNLIREKGYELGNIDSTICLQKPKIGPYIAEMQKVLASCMGVNQDLVSIKATTTEKLSFVGREEGVSAYATVLIQKN
jgi:2-C-methyl-D-erythritol 2,4-cyclodiphosphate synthase